MSLINTVIVSIYKKAKEVFDKNWFIAYGRNKSLHRIIIRDCLLKSKEKFPECLST